MKKVMGMVRGLCFVVVLLSVAEVAHAKEVSRTNKQADNAAELVRHIVVPYLFRHGLCECFGGRCGGRILEIANVAYTYYRFRQLVNSIDQQEALEERLAEALNRQTAHLE